ncbi:MAG: hypothetical protein R3F39_15600 [Myxococcota bacterium]
MSPGQITVMSPLAWLRSLVLPLARWATLAAVCALSAACGSNPTPHPGTGGYFADAIANPPENGADSGGDTATGGAMGDTLDTSVAADTVPGRYDDLAANADADGETDGDTEGDGAADGEVGPDAPAGSDTVVGDDGPARDLEPDPAPGARPTPESAARFGPGRPAGVPI